MIPGDLIDFCFSRRKKDRSGPRRQRHSNTAPRIGRVANPYNAETFRDIRKINSDSQYLPSERRERTSRASGGRHGGGWRGKERSGRREGRYRVVASHRVGSGRVARARVANCRRGIFKSKFSLHISLSL